MRALLQRVKQASVTSGGKTVAAIEAGLLVLFCAEGGDHESDAGFLAGKIARMRIFADDNAKMNRSIMDISGSVLVVSQFTLAANWRKGNRPGFSRAARPEMGRALYDQFCEALRREDITVETGVFGADMEVSLINDGPVTIWMDSAEPY